MKNAGPAIGRVLIATTLRTKPFMKKLIAVSGVSTGSTYDHVTHLSTQTASQLFVTVSGRDLRVGAVPDRRRTER